MNEKRRKIPIHDLYFIAFTLLHDVIPEPQIINNRVAFLYTSGSDFTALLEDYYKAKVNLIDYIGALKKAKSLMYAAKDELQRGNAG